MKYLCISLLLILSIQAFGQFTKGDKVLGGELNLDIRHRPEVQNSGYDFKSTSFSISPDFGVFITSNIEVGGQIYFATNKSKSMSPTPNDTESEYNIWSLGAYIKRYFRITDRFLFSLGGAFGYGLGKSTSKTYDSFSGRVITTENKENSIGIGLTPRFSFFPSENWAFQLSIGNIGYGIKKDLESDLKEYNFDVNYGTIGLGVSYFFRKKAKE